MKTLSRKIYAVTLKKARTVMHRHGIDDAVLLANTELSPGDIDDPHHLITEEQARVFYRNVIVLAGEPGIGLEIGWMTGITDKGSLGLMQIAARTVRDAVVEGWLKRDTYHGMIDWTYEINDDVIIHKLTCQEEGPLRVFLLERALGIFQANSEDLAGTEVRPIKVLLDYRAPEHIKRYEEVFRCPLFFEQPGVEIHYPISFLDNEVESYDKPAHDALVILQASLLRKVIEKSDFVSEVKLALRRKCGEFPGLEQIAQGLAMSPRTLRRKLGAEGVGFQDLLDEERRRIAEDYLSNSDLSIQQIAEQCDFSDAQNFSQAFKRWCGMSPSDFRSSHHH